MFARSYKHPIIERKVRYLL